MTLIPNERTYMKDSAGLSTTVRQPMNCLADTMKHLQNCRKLLKSPAVIAARYPLSDEYRGLHASMQVRRAGIHSRVGHFDLAVQDLRQAAMRLEQIVEKASNSAQSFRMLLKAERMLAVLQHSHGHLQEAEETFGKMKLHGETFANRFPETAVQSWELASLPIRYRHASVRSWSGRGSRPDSAESSGFRLQQTPTPGATALSASSLEVRNGLIKIQIWLNQQTKARELTDAAAQSLEEFKKQLPDSANWGNCP